MSAASAPGRLSVSLPPLAGRLTSAVDTLRKILFFSLADDRVTYRKGLAVSFEKGLITVCAGSRLLSSITIRQVKDFPSDPAAFPDPDTFAATVQMAATEMKLGKTPVVLCLPRAWTVATVAEFPVTIRENIRAAIGSELDRITPFSALDAYFDYRVVREEGGRLTVLVAAARAELVQPYLDALKDRGIAVASATTPLLSIGDLAAYRREQMDFIYVRDRQDSVEGALFQDGAPRSVFALEKSAQTETSLDRLHEELEPMVRSLRDGGLQPEILLSADTGGERLRDRLLQLTGAKVSLAGEFLPEGSPALDRASALPACGGLLGQLRPGSLPLDLLSRGQRKKERVPLALTVLLVAAIIAAVAAYLYAPLQIERKRTAEFDRMIAAKKDEVRKVEDLKKQIDALSSGITTVRTFRTKKPLTVNIVREITTILPGGAWLTRLHVSDRQVDIEGYAASATELIPKLEKSPYLSKVELASTTFHDVRLNADRFVIRAGIEGVRIDEKPEGGSHEKK